MEKCNWLILQQFIQDNMIDSLKIPHGLVSMWDFYEISYYKGQS